ncbi:MAG: LTA synthase family protein [Bacteroidales bacterium]|nr:LTA synthase family protein [Candidatus Colimorpha onthohippi]
MENFAEVLGVLWGNVRFGFATLVIVLSPYLLLNLLPLRIRWKGWFRKFTDVFLFWIPLMLVLVGNFADGCYYQYTYRRLTSEIFSYMRFSGGMGEQAVHYITDFWYAYAVFAVLMVLLIYRSSKYVLANRSKYNRYLANDICGMVVSFALLFFVARGGAQPKWLSFEDAADHCQPKNMPLVTNSIFTLLESTNKPLLLPDTDFNMAAGVSFSTRFTPLVATDSLSMVNSGCFCNVVLIVLESFSQEYMGCYNTSLKYSCTPFLDSLSQYCTCYQGRSNSKKSIESIATIISSRPTLMSLPYSMSGYCPDTLEALPRILGRNSYHTAFFHGCHNGSMGFDELCAKAGFGRYVGFDEYVADQSLQDSDYDHAWGIYDKPFLQYTAQVLSKIPEPFFGMIFTISSHHPYSVPSDFEVPDALKGQHPLLSVVSYTDRALRDFFEICSKQQWYNNTLFIITGDHPGQGLSPRYNDYDGWYDVPMLFFEPWNPKHQVSERIFQHADLQPTIIDYLRINGACYCMGTSAIQSPNYGFQLLYGDGYYQLLENDSQNPSVHNLTVRSGNLRIGSDAGQRKLEKMLIEYKKLLRTRR